MERRRARGVGLDVVAELGPDRWVARGSPLLIRAPSGRIPNGATITVTGGRARSGPSGLSTLSILPLFRLGAPSAPRLGRRLLYVAREVYAGAGERFVQKSFTVVCAARGN